MLQRQLSLLAACSTEAPMVSARTGQDLPALPPPAIRIDDDGESGPLGGIVPALSHTAADHLLVIAVDLPKLSEHELRPLCQRIKTPDHGVYAETPGGPQPLVSIIPRCLLPELQTALAEGQLSLRSLLAGPLRTRMIAVAFADETPFQNWNAPEASEG